MTEEIASIDDRSFQDLVDEAKRLIPRLCPEWTNHGPTDPGVALIEVFAWMTTQLIDRLNAIPERVHEAFVRLVGIEPFPATAARVDLLVMTTTDDFETLTIPKGTPFSTIGRDGGHAVQFAADDEVRLWRPWLASVGTVNAAGQFVDRTATTEGFACFASSEPGEALALGMSRSCADHLLRIDIDASVADLGVDPRDPPLVWQAWSTDQRGWETVPVLSDTTGGLCRSGAVVVVMPSDHEPTQFGAHTANWLRVQLLAERPGQVTYRELPQVRSISVATVGGVVRASHSSAKIGELLGISDGSPGQTFRTSQSPLLPRTDDEHVLVVDQGATSEWHEVADFSASGPSDHHYTIESATGTVRFGPTVTQADGTTVQHGAIVPAGAQLSLAAYRVGGGSIGNVGPWTVTVLGLSLPYIDRVENPLAAAGGFDAEDLQAWKARSRLSLQTGGRAVTAADFERIACWAHPGVARVLCLDPSVGGAVRLLVVPRVWSKPSTTTLDELALRDDVLAAVADEINRRRLIGTAVEITTPSFIGVSVVARVRPQTYHADGAVRRRCLDALAGLLHPTTGGAGGDGWPFGRDVDELAIGSALSGVDGVEEVVEVLIFEADLATGERSGVGRRRLQLSADSLPLLVRPHVVIDRWG